MKVVFGGWYQRTTLHMSEVYDLFALGHSKLPLDSEKLKKYKADFNFTSVTREPGYLEYIEAKTKDGIIVHYFEDGLYTLEIESKNVHDAQSDLEKFYNDRLLPAISYIFSLGAPTPKIVANIKTEHPIVVTENVSNLENFKIDVDKYGETYSKIISGNFAVFKTPMYIFVLSDHKKPEILSNLVDMQIFFREFKDQLEKYLDIHRNIWEEISALKEKKQIRGAEISKYRSKLEQYLTTINLITNRINQMGSYVRTRQTVSKEMEIEESLSKLFQFKFDSLEDTLGYIKEIWSMTEDYTKSSLKLLEDLENTSLNNSIKSLQIITSIGVVAGILGYLSKDSLPTPTFYGIMFFAILAITSLLINFAISLIYRNLRYQIKFKERKEDI